MPLFLQQLNSGFRVLRRDTFLEFFKRRRTRVFNSKKNPIKPRFAKTRQNLFVSDDVVASCLNKPSRILVNSRLMISSAISLGSIAPAEVVICKPDEFAAKRFVAVLHLIRNSLRRLHSPARLPMPPLSTKSALM